MKSKKGFTLLEVLLVIDILVIISLIAIPIVMSNIDSARKQTFKSDVNSVFRSAEINLRTTVPSEMTCYSLGYADVTHKDKFISGQVCKDSNHNYEVKNLCTKDYCFNGPLETGTQTESYINKLPMIKYLNYDSGLYFYHSDYRSNIINIEVVTTKNVPSNAVKSWDISNDADGSVMAWIVKNNQDITKYDLYIGGEGGVKANSNCWRMFYNMTNVKKIDLNNFYTHDTYCFAYMFRGNVNLEYLYIENLNTYSGRDFHSMFRDIKVSSLDLSHFNTAQATEISEMFAQCSSLKKLNISNFNTSKVTNMSHMFWGCSQLKEINLNNFDTSSVKKMSYMFYNCSVLESLNLSNFNTSNVTDMTYMFNNCYLLKNLNLSTFDTSNVNKMAAMFGNCTSLEKLDLSNFNTKNVLYMNHMFCGCKKLRELNISNFDTSNVTRMDYMFCELYVIPYLNLKSFDTSQVQYMQFMFGYTGALNKIDVTNGKWVTTHANTTDMFTGSRTSSATYN